MIVPRTSREEIMAKLKAKVDKKIPIGVITEKDLWQAVSPYVGTLSETERDLATLNKRAHQIMRRNHPTVTRETTIEEAAQKLLEKGIACLPVISHDGTIEGIVTWKDIIRALLRR